MNTDIKNEVSAAGNKAQYDARAKRLLGNKYILAYILKETIPEFKKRKIDTILPCIEDGCSDCFHLGGTGGDKS